MTVTILSLFVVVTVIAQGAQQKPETDAKSATAAAPIPTVDQILDKYVQAVGGKAAIEKPKTRINERLTGCFLSVGLRRGRTPS